VLLLVRHGQSTYNVEGRLPGQLPGIPLTDEGRRQAHRAAVALSALPLSAIISSPLERAAETAEIIARGWGLTVRTDPCLMDTNVERWAGQKIDEVAKNDPAWKRYVANPDEPPEGAESFSSVQARAVAVAREALADPNNGDYIVLVAHGDVVKLILAQYMNTPIPCVPFLAIGNASISGMAFTGDSPPQILATNWTPDPRWLVAPATPPPLTPGAPAPETPKSADGGQETSTNG
jgi:probable phosphoglycerate mutase